MANLTARGGNNGKRVQPVNALGISSWDCSSPVTLTLIRAGHMPGVYSFSIAVAPIVTATSGTLTISVTYDAPGVGPTTIIYQSAGAINNGFLAPRHLMSSGAGPIVLTFTPAAIVGAPRFYLNAPLDFILARFPGDYPS